MKLSVIIPSYNAIDTIAVQLDALTQQQWHQPWELIVSDNGSTDGTPELVRRYQKHSPNLRLVDSSHRKGAAHARNVGAQAATSPALAFCDADDKVAPGWLAAIGEALTRHNFVASRFDTEELNVDWVQKSHTNPQRDGLNNYTYPPYLPHAGGSGIGVQRVIHEAIGGFDESMQILEDTDYCWRIQLTGITLHFVFDAVVQVRYPHTLRAIYRQAYGYAEYNVLLYKKYRPLGMPKLSWRTGLAQWKKLARQTLQIRNRKGLARWIWNLGWRIGRLQGCIKHRVLAL